MWMADAGVPLHVLRKIAGHGSLTTTQRYLHPDRRSIHLAGAALSAHLSGAETHTQMTPETAPGPKVVPRDRSKRHPRVVR
ncbi:site-specific integrase [Streptomyces sp. HPF1205]|uniref:site-specific integrase n=1 Tax=Streptomyces sp. HPF1205 TaxID=2873262 RepID=UPI0021F1CCF9|nr:site-specific integrase [Streptomyces sp. HPF1205]